MSSFCPFLRGVTTILGPTLGLGSSQLVLKETPWAQGADVEGRLQNELAGPAFPRNALRTHIYYFFEAFFYHAQQSSMCQTSLMGLGEEEENI